MTKKDKSATGWHPFDEIRGKHEVPNSFKRRESPSSANFDVMYSESKKPFSRRLISIKDRQVETSKEVRDRNRRKRHNMIDRLAERDGGRVCFYCKKELEYKYCTLDHVIPRSKGGKDSFKNYVIACGNCNQDKADKILERR